MSKARQKQKQREVKYEMMEDEQSVESATPLGDIIKSKKEKKKAKKEKLIAQLERKRQLEDASSEDTKAGDSKKIRFESIFDAQKAEGNRKGRSYTVSLALAGSILDNAQTPELRTYLAGQIARALAVFSIDEVVVFSDDKNPNAKGNSQLVNILQFLECPQYLRKEFFPIHKDLKFAGVLNPTDMPHHLRAYEESQFREGVTLDKTTEDGKASIASTGLRKECELDKKLEPGVRVTIKLLQETKKVFKGQVVSPNIPREEYGLYWGYTVRFAPNLSEVFTKSPFKGGYDLTIGTSERGQNCDQLQSFPAFKHLLIVFGGVKGLEAALEADPELDVQDPEPLFDLYLNTCPMQGSRTIRTEEAILISLAAMRSKIWSS